MRKSLVLPGLACLCLVFASPSAGETKAPEWVEKHGKTEDYPQDTFVVGFGESALSALPGMCVETAKNLARSDVARQIREAIKALTEEQKQKIAGKEQNFVRCLAKSTADLPLEGIEVVDLYRLFRHESAKACYSLAVLNKEEARRRLRTNIANTNKEIKNLYKKALIGELVNPSRSVVDYMRVKSRLNLARRQTAILLALGGSSLGLETDLDPIKINEKMEDLLSRSTKDLDLAVTRLAYEISRAIDPGLRILVDRFVRKPGIYSGSLAWYLSSGLEDQLVQSCGFQVIDRLRLTGHALAAGQFENPHAPEVRGKLVGADAVLYGYYQEEGDNLVLSAYLTDLAKGESLAAATVRVAKSAMEDKQLSSAPPNQPQHIPLPPEMSTPKLRIQVWTDRGDGGVYKEGEKMYVYVKANHDAYLRLVYSQADSTNVQIFPNAYIAENRIKKDEVVMFPDRQDSFEFEIAPPCGAELLQVFASTEPFADLPGIETNDGFLVLDNDLGTIFAQARGIKAEKKDALYAEAKCVVNTVSEYR